MGRIGRVFFVAGMAATMGLLGGDVSAQTGGWLVFEGHGYAEVSADRSPAPTAGLTIEAWIYLTDPLAHDGNGCLSLAGRDFTQSYWFGVCNGRLRLYTHGTGSQRDGEQTLPLNRWVHVAAAYDGSRTRFYIDGALDREVDAEVGPMPDSGKEFRVGSDVAWPHSPVGMMDRVRVWDRALAVEDLFWTRAYDLPPTLDGLLFSLSFNLNGSAYLEFLTAGAGLEGDVALGDGVAPCRIERWIPAGAHAAGAGGSQWRTDLDLVNTGSVDNGVSITFHPRGGGAVYGPHEITLAAGGAVRLEDAVASAFGLDSAAGSLRICAEFPFWVSSRTYNLTAGNTTFGQGIAGVGWEDAVYEGILPGLSEDGRFRTNLGIVNPGPETTTVTVTLRDAEGATLGSRDWTVGPRSSIQVNRVYREVTDEDVTGGWITIASSTGRVFAYASVVDEATGDGSYQLARGF